MADWHKIYAADWVNLTYQVSDPILASALMMMMMHCLNQGGLPEDPEDIADVTRLPVETVKAVLDLRCVKRALITMNGVLSFSVVSQMVEERVEFGRKQSVRRRGGKTEPESGQPIVSAPLNGQPEQEESHHGQPRSTTVNQGAPIQSIKQSSRQAVRAIARDPASPGALSEDEDADLRDSLALLVREATGTQAAGGGRIEARVNEEVAELVSAGASVSEVGEFWATRRKAVTLGFFVQDFLKWRVDGKRGNGSHAPPVYEDWTGRGAEAQTKPKGQ